MGAYSRILLPWDSQPQEVVGVDWGNPNAANITTLIPLGPDNRDAVLGTPLTLGAGGSVAVDARGRSLKGSGSAAVGSIPLNLSAYNKLALSFWGYWDAFANDDDFFAEFTANSNSANGFYVDPNSSTTNFAIQVGNSAPQRKTAHFTRPSAAAWHHYLLTFDTTTGAGSNGLAAYVDGVLQTLTWVNTDNMSSSLFANNTLYLFSRANSSLFGAGRMQNLVIRGGVIGTEALAKWEYQNPWQLFAPRTIWVPVSAGVGGGTTGTLATTNANDTSAASGTTTAVGASATTNANDTSSAAGTTTVTGTLARSNASDTSAASGTTTVLGTLATSNADDTSAASGSVGSSGSTGTVNATNANDTSAAAGTTTVTGAVARSNADDSVSASGWAGLISGTVNANNANDTAAATGSGGTATAQASGGGIYPAPRRKTKQEIDADRKRLGILPDEPEPAIQTGIVEVPKRPRITLAQLIGKPAADTHRADMERASAAHKLRKRRQDDDFLMMM